MILSFVVWFYKGFFSLIFVGSSRKKGDNMKLVAGGCLQMQSANVILSATKNWANFSLLHIFGTVERDCRRRTKEKTNRASNITWREVDSLGLFSDWL